MSADQLRQGEAAWPTCPETNERCAWVGGCSQPCAPQQSDVKCPASWVPTVGGPGYQCAKNAGHDGLHDPTPQPERSEEGANRQVRTSDWATPVPPPVAVAEDASPIAAVPKNAAHETLENLIDKFELLRDSLIVGDAPSYESGQRFAFGYAATCVKNALAAEAEDES